MALGYQIKVARVPTTKGCFTGGLGGGSPKQDVFWLPKRNLAIMVTPLRVKPIITQSSRIENSQHECKAFIKQDKQKPPKQ